MSRADRRRRVGWLLTLTSMLLSIGVLFVWASSWQIETEIRWMHRGFHRHLELAQGTITYVTTSDCESADYFVVARSPDLSFNRDPNWYAINPPGQTRWHVRLHWTVCLTLIVLLSTAAIMLSMSLITMKSNEGTI